MRAAALLCAVLVGCAGQCQAVGGGAVGAGSVGKASPGGDPLPPDFANLAIWADPRGVDADDSGDGAQVEDYAATGDGALTLGWEVASPAQVAHVSRSCFGVSPCFVFDGGDRAADVILRAEADFLHDGTDWTVYAAARRLDASTRAGGLLTTSAASNSKGTRIDLDTATTGVQLRISDGTAYRVTGNEASPDADTAWHFYAIVLDGGAAGNDAVGYVDGAQVFSVEPSAAYGTGDAAKDLDVGVGTETVVNPMTAALGQLLIYYGAHDAVQRAAVEQWLTNVGTAAGAAATACSRSAGHMLGTTGVGRICAIGDSTTDQRKVTSDGTRRAWPEVLISDADGGSTCNTLDDIATSGATVAGITTQYTSCGTAHDLVTVLGGINNINAGNTAAATWATLEALVDSIVTDGKKVILITPTPYKGNSGWTSAEQTELDSLNTSILAKTCSGCVVLDAYSALEDPENADYLLPAYDSGDGLHYSAAGMLKVAELVGDCLDDGVCP